MEKELHPISREMPRRAQADSNPVLSNAEIANKLLALAQLLGAKGENPFKVKAYRRAARTVRAVGDSFVELVHSNSDLTTYPGIGTAISGVIQEIVRTGTTQQLERLRQEKPEVADLADYPLLDPKRVRRVYKKLGIASIPELKQRLEAGDVAKSLGTRMDHHIRRALIQQHEILWYEAQVVVAEIRKFLLVQHDVRRAEPAGDYRRRVEVLSEVSFVVETPDLSALISALKRYGGRAELLSREQQHASLRLPSGLLLRVHNTDREHWGAAWIAATGSAAHLRKLAQLQADVEVLLREAQPYPDEESVYAKYGLSFVAPELREGGDELELAANGQLPTLITIDDIRGDLHAHTRASDGADTIEAMAAAAAEKGYEYLGISDHSQSLKIAGGLSEDELWQQIRAIDNLNEKLEGIRLLKSAEVDILVDGSLDYPDELLKELDYTVCSIHSRFGFGKTEQTERILRAMDNRYFNILGHATGRLLLKRPGYELDIERIVEHARQNRCYFEINSSPDRLDLSAENARVAREAGVKVAVTTDAHSTGEFGTLQYGIDQARRAGISKESVLNHLPLADLLKSFRR